MKDEKIKSVIGMTNFSGCYEYFYLYFTIFLKWRSHISSFTVSENQSMLNKKEYII